MRGRDGQSGEASRPGRRKRVVLAIDVGGSHVKILTSAGGDGAPAHDSGPGLTPQQMIAAVKTLAEGLSISTSSRWAIRGRCTTTGRCIDPANLGKGWVGYDFAAQFGKPVKMVNDALMQAIGSYEGGRMLFLGLGTGPGRGDDRRQRRPADGTRASSLQARAAASKTMSANAAWKSAARRNGANTSSTSSTGFAPPCSRTTSSSAAAMSTNSTNCRADCRRGDNTRAFEGGFRLWRDKALIV